MSVETFDVTQEAVGWAKVPYWLLVVAKPQSVVVYAALASWANLKDGARPSMTTISKRINVSVSTVERAVADLVAVGAVTVEHRTETTPNGKRYLPSRYHLHLTRKFVTEGTPTNEGTPVTEGTPPPAGDATLPPQMTAEEEGVSKTQVSKTLVASDAEFDAWWKAYPRKSNKPASLKAYKKARKTKTAEFLLEAVNAYPWNPDPKFIPHPSTWLNNERWEDDHAIARVTNRPESRYGQKPSIRETAEQMAEAAAALQARFDAQSGPQQLQIGS